MVTWGTNQLDLRGNFVGRDAAAARSGRLPETLKKMDTRARFDAFTTPLDALPSNGRIGGGGGGMFRTAAWNFGEWRERGAGVCVGPGR